MTDLFLSQAGGEQAQGCASAGVILLLAQEAAWEALHSGVWPGPILHGRTG